MADELSRTIKLNYAKGGAAIAIDVNYKTTQAGIGFIENLQTVGNTSEAINFGDVTDPQSIAYKNLNPTWASLTAGEKVTEVDQATYELKHTVHVGTLTPCVAATATYHFVPGAGVVFDTVITAWYTISQTATPVHLVVFAIQR